MIIVEKNLLKKKKRACVIDYTEILAKSAWTKQMKLTKTLSLKAISRYVAYYFSSVGIKIIKLNPKGFLPDEFRVDIIWHVLSLVNRFLSRSYTGRKL